MKKAAILMVFVLLLSLGGTVWLYLTSGVSVESVQAIATEAATQLPTFESLQRLQKESALTGTVFSQEPIGAAEDYQFLTYTVRLKNSSFLTADMVEVQVTPMSQDVLQLWDETAHALRGRSSGNISATILTTADSHAIRELSVTYYMLGVPFNIRTTYTH